MNVGNKDGDIRAIFDSSKKFKAPRFQKKKRADVSGIIEEEHGKYSIKAGRLGGAFVARAFPAPPAKSQGMIAEATGDSEQSAIAALKAMIEARDARRTEERRWDEKSAIAVPNEDEYIEALRQSKLSQAQIAMLKAHSIAGEDGLTLRQLATAADYKSTDTAGRVFKKAGVLIADYLGIEIAGNKTPQGDGGEKILAFKNTLEGNAPTVWIMHPELCNAVRATI